MTAWVVQNLDYLQAIAKKYKNDQIWRYSLLRRKGALQRLHGIVDMGNCTMSVAVRTCVTIFLVYYDWVVQNLDCLQAIAKKYKNDQIWSYSFIA